MPARIAASVRAFAATAPQAAIPGETVPIDLLQMPGLRSLHMVVWLLSWKLNKETTMPFSETLLPASALDFGVFEMRPDFKPASEAS